MPYPFSKRAFTLVELSVVLTILGLLVGGVLAGQSLVEAARLRKFTTQLAEINTAVVAFKSKYDCLPGDCVDLHSMTGIEAGDGDGKINNYAPYGSITTARNLGCETTDAFSAMNQAGLLSGSYDAASREVGTGIPAVMGQKDRGGIGFFYYGDTHYFRTGSEAPDAYGGGSPAGFSPTCTDTLSYMRVYSFTPEEAYKIVTKLGDKGPNQSIKIVGHGNYNLFDWITTTDGGNTPSIIGPTPGATTPICYETTNMTFNLQYPNRVCNLVIPTGF